MKAKIVTEQGKRKIQVGKLSMVVLTKEEIGALSTTGLAGYKTKLKRVVTTSTNTEGDVIRVFDFIRHSIRRTDAARAPRRG